jgi:NAD(P)-dependent dehydrogenase (short-subunit alcohol dehydrogenase family)
MNNNIVITGANRGIGLAMCMHFKAQGNRVFALCRKTSVELTALDVHIIEDIDVTSDFGIANMVSGLKHVDIDVLVCNAGILRDETLVNLDLNTIREQFEVNALAPLRMVASLKKQFKQGAKVALITSRMGSIADNDSGGRYGYRMSKAALNAAAMSLSHDLASNKVAVGIYHPGYVQTEMVNYGGDISANDAAKKLVELIDQLTLAQSGIFKHSNGNILPW